MLSHTIGRFQRRFNGQSFTYHILPQNNFVAVESVSGKTLPDDFLRISRSQVFPRRIRKTSSHQGASRQGGKEPSRCRGGQCWDRIVSRSWLNHSWLMMEWIHWLMELFIHIKKPMRHLTFFIWRSKSCWFLQNGSIWKRLICPCSCRT